MQTRDLDYYKGNALAENRARKSANTFVHTFCPCKPTSTKVPRQALAICAAAYSDNWKYGIHMVSSMLQIIINDDLEQGYKQLKAAIGRFRPDLIAPADDNDAAQAGKKAAASNQPVPLVVQGPTGAKVFGSIGMMQGLQLQTWLSLLTGY